MSSIGFRVGERVEVIGSGTGFENSYYAARIIQWARHHVRVRYETLTDDNGEGPLEENVRINSVRPYPANIVAYYSPGDSVDVWHNEGWWRGKYRRFDIVNI